MDKLENLSEIEAGLERLMPRGLSDDCQQELTTTIDELVVTSGYSVWQRFKPQPSTIAAVLTLSVVGISLGFWAGHNRDSIASNTTMEATLLAEESFGSIATLESSVWIDEGEDLGIRYVNESGDAHRGWTYMGVEEERVLHEDSGYEVILQRGFESEFYATTSL